LLALASDSDDPISLYISSPGGHVESGDVIYDIIKFIKPPVRVIGTGWVASAATTIYLAAEKDKRFALPNTRFLIHQPLGGSRGDATDIAIQAEQMVRTKARINQLIAKETGQPLDRVAKDTDRDYWMTVDEAVSYGIVSNIIESIDELS
jgi:ATP-dependent Clp protease protease subunit